jgi:hypothetical protein
MKTNRNRLLARFHALLRELGAEQHKEAIYAARGVAGSRELSDGQLLEIIEQLEGERATVSDAAVRTLRSNALRLLTDIGVYYVAAGEGQADCWRRVNDFLMQDRIAGRRLYALDIQGLKALVRKLRAMKDKGYRYRAAGAATGGEPAFSVRVITLQPAGQPVS